MTRLSVQEIQQGLKTQSFGKVIHYFEQVQSTNTLARERAQAGAPEGEIVIADSQTCGRGRLGRRWLSPPGTNLYLSVILRPALLPQSAAQLTLTSAVAVAETVQSFIGRPPEIKWPNDILVHGKKLAGILCEGSFEGNETVFVILGIGVNVNFSQEAMPEEIRNQATSLLLLTQQPVSRALFARHLIENLERCYENILCHGFGPLAQRWNTFFRTAGRRVKVEMVDGVILGTVLGIDRDGALILQKDGGIEQRVVEGDVVPI